MSRYVLAVKDASGNIHIGKEALTRQEHQQRLARMIYQAPEQARWGYFLVEFPVKNEDVKKLYSLEDWPTPRVKWPHKPERISSAF